MEDLDTPLSIISPATKTTTMVRKKTNEDGAEKKASSLRFTRKVQLTTDPIKSTENRNESTTQEKTASTRTKLVLATKSSIDIRNKKGESLLHLAVTKGDINRAKQLIDDGHSVNTIDHNSWTPLHEVKRRLNI